MLNVPVKMPRAMSAKPTKRPQGSRSTKGDKKYKGYIRRVFQIERPDTQCAHQNLEQGPCRSESQELLHTERHDTQALQAHQTHHAQNTVGIPSMDCTHVDRAPVCKVLARPWQRFSASFRNLVSLVMLSGRQLNKGELDKSRTSSACS